MRQAIGQVRLVLPTGPVQQPVPPAPPRWKQAVTIWLGFFPTNLLASWLLGFVPGFTEWPLILRVLLATLLLTPVMTYAVLPWVRRSAVATTTSSLPVARWASMPGRSPSRCS